MFGKWAGFGLVSIVLFYSTVVVTVLLLCVMSYCFRPCAVLFNVWSRFGQRYSAFDAGDLGILSPLGNRQIAVGVKSSPNRLA